MRRQKHMCANSTTPLMVNILVCKRRQLADLKHTQNVSTKCFVIPTETFAQPALQATLKRLYNEYVHACDVGLRINACCCRYNCAPPLLQGLQLRLVLERVCQMCHDVARRPTRGLVLGKCSVNSSANANHYSLCGCVFVGLCNCLFWFV